MEVGVLGTWAVLAQNFDANDVPPGGEELLAVQAHTPDVIGGVGGLLTLGKNVSGDLSGGGLDYRRRLLYPHYEVRMRWAWCQ